jgi:hypothetical protein
MRRWQLTGLVVGAAALLFTAGPAQAQVWIGPPVRPVPPVWGGPSVWVGAPVQPVPPIGFIPPVQPVPPIGFVPGPGWGTRPYWGARRAHGLFRRRW